jgi:hypothetical protein
MSLKLNSSGGGSVTLQEPTTASNVTLNLPAADGTVVYENASGNVGIGTSSPDAKLHVDGSATVSSQVNVAARIGPGVDSDLLLGSVNGNTPFVASQGAYPLAFYTNAAERARIDSSGNLLVGTTTAISKVSILHDSSAFGLGIHNTDTGTAGQIAIRFMRNTADRGSITTTNTGTQYNTTSDYRLKHDIAPMQNALATVAQLKPVTYKWNADNSESQGFIAHELQAVVPDCVTGEKDAVDADGNPVYQGIDTSFLIATLTAGLQEAVAMIEELKAKVAALEAQ